MILRPHNMDPARCMRGSSTKVLLMDIFVAISQRNNVFGNMFKTTRHFAETEPSIGMY